MLLYFITVTFGIAANGHLRTIEHETGLEVSNISYRLPRHIRPILYEIFLEPHLEPGLNPATFTGAVIIELKVMEKANNVTLHGKQLNLTENKIKILHTSGQEIGISKIVKDDLRDFFIFYTITSLIEDETYILIIEEYHGILNLENKGFYLAKYYDKRGRERRLATTQFEPTYARQAYPCFDEPHMKAEFIISLIRSENFSSISNEELLHTTNLGGGRYKDTYKKTVIMSTYLTAFVVSDYKHTNKTERHRVFADEDAIDNGEAEYALKTAIELLTTFEHYFNVNYTLSKMDQIAIPDDYFKNGAMENWGLVTYRKSLLLYSNLSASIIERQFITETIAHEFAHQWFGDLVTCVWWRYIWLHEGFADYFQSFITALVKPEWDVSQTFLLESVHKALRHDNSNTTKPMNYDYINPEDEFDYNAYAKGGSVIRMFEHFLTSSVFKRGLSIYLNKYAFSTAKPHDLYGALQKALKIEKKEHLLANLTVSDILVTWDSQSGYPVVNVKRNYQTGSITLSQRCFRFNEKIEDNSVWYIPINIFTAQNSSSDTTADFWLINSTDTIQYSLSKNSWLLVNKQQTGYYRVNYDRVNWMNLIGFLNDQNINDIPVLNRAQLIDDTFNLARAGQLHYYTPLFLSKYLVKETEYAPTQAFLNAIEFLNLVLFDAPEYSLFQNYVIDILSGLYKNLGFVKKQNDRHLDKRTRINVLRWLCKIGHKECRENSLKYILSWQKDNKTSLTPDMEEYVFCGAMRIANYNSWTFLYQKYEKAANTSHKRRLLLGLGCSEDENILNRFLDKILRNNSSLSIKERNSILIAVSDASSVGLNLLLDYLGKNFEELQSRVNLKDLLASISPKLTTSEQLNKVINLCNKYNLSPLLFEKVMKDPKENIQWRKREFLDVIKSWLITFSETSVTKNLLDHLM
ncbi:hypothetical protein ILUMI_13662 [Ignelater luminosus]|uniref:Aminopeptidase n=1 Tax=Ignelater luminosus TaxID=2038154 RepID=A0A8K0D0B2_IGNLU|nr:hypothetical protein ILUMI_13662 [Ignelater luminosus]